MHDETPNPPEPTAVDSPVRAVGGRAALLGESPVWSTSEQCLYWADIEGRMIRRYDPTSGHTDERKCLGRPGSIALTRRAGVLLVAVEHQLAWLEWKSGAMIPWIDLEAAGTGNRLNDGRTDPTGRFVVGSMYADTGADLTTGALHIVDADGGVSTVRRDVGVSNGLGFDAQREHMYFADTPTETVWRYDYDAATGTPTRPVEFLDYTGLDGKPDGACVDADGCYWSASVYGWAVIRVTPDGAVDRQVDVPVEKPSMPAFGGPDLSTLYITTIGAAGSKPSAPGREGFEPGQLLAVDVDVAGVEEPPFAGEPPAFGS